MRKEGGVSAALSAATVVILSPYPMWLDALGRVVAGAGVGSVGLAPTAEQGLALVEELGAELLVVDSQTAGFDTVLAFMRSAPEKGRQVRSIVVADRDELGLLERAFDAGAFACVLRTADPEDLEVAIRHAFSQSIYFSSGDPAARGRGSVVPLTSRGAAERPLLTRREIEILRLAAAGRSNADVARRLWVTEQTVKFHLSNVYRKLRVANRTQAAHWARRHGLLDLDADDDDPPVGDVG